MKAPITLAEAEVQLCVAAGALMAIEKFVRERMKEAHANGVYATALEMDAMTKLVLFAGRCRTQLQERVNPAGRQFSAKVAEIMQSDVSESASAMIDALAATSCSASADSARPVISSFVNELGRLLAYTAMRRVQTNLTTEEDRPAPDEDDNEDGMYGSGEI